MAKESLLKVEIEVLSVNLNREDPRFGHVVLCISMNGAPHPRSPFMVKPNDKITLNVVSPEAS